MILRVFFILLYLSFFQLAISQEISENLLIEKISQSKGLQKAELCNQLAELLFENNPSSSEIYARKALEIATAENNPELEAITRKNLGNALLQQGKNDDALRQYTVSVRIFYNLQHKAYLAVCLNNIGAIYQSYSDFARAKDFYELALSLEEQLGDTTGVAECLMNIGNTYYLKGDFHKAYRFYHKALKMHLLRKDSISGADCRLNMGAVAQSMKNFSLAYENLKQAEIIFSSNRMINELAMCYENQADIFSQTGDFESAFELYGNAFDLAEKTENLPLKGTILLNTAKSWVLCGKKEQALHYLQQAVAIFNQTGNTKGIASVYLETAEILFNEKDVSKSLSYLERAGLYADTAGALTEKKEILKLFSSIYYQEGNLEKAYQNLLQAEQISDSLLNLPVPEINIMLSDTIDGLYEKIYSEQKQGYSQSQLFKYLTIILTTLLLILIIGFIWVKRK